MRHHLQYQVLEILAENRKFHGFFSWIRLFWHMSRLKRNQFPRNVRDAAKLRFFAEILNRVSCCFRGALGTYRTWHLWPSAGILKQPSLRLCSVCWKNIFRYVKNENKIALTVFFYLCAWKFDKSTYCIVNINTLYVVLCWSSW